MSSLLFRQVTVCDPSSPFNNQVKDVLIIDGKIHAIESSLNSDQSQVVEGKGLLMMPAFVDIGTWVGEPGKEEREDFKSVRNAALAGGFSQLVVLPSTSPAIDNKASVEFITKQSKDIEFFALGAVSKQLKGEQMAELYDMHQAGALGFTDASKGLDNAGLLLRALEYVKAFDGIILQQPDSPSLSNAGMMHEGNVHVTLGLKGIPSVAEEIAISRDIALTAYSNSRLHFLNLTTEKSIKEIKEAIKNGVKVSASLSSLYLLLSDEALLEFDSNFKLAPPLRDKNTIDTLKSAVLDGTISIINSGHMPRTIEEKEVEFAYAANGSINLETCFSALITAFGDKLSNDMIVNLMSHNPRKLLGISPVTIAVGQEAQFNLIDKQQTYTFTQNDIKSKSKNSALLGKQLQGKVKGVFTKNVWHQN